MFSGQHAADPSLRKLEAPAKRSLSSPGRRRLAVLLCGLLLTLIGSANYLFNLDQPRGPYWDENYYLTAIARYAEDRPQFASHPPLGLMLLAIGDRIAGVNSTVDLDDLARVKTVGETRLPAGYRIWSARLASALFGVAIILTVYAVLLSAKFEPAAAAAVATLVAFETAFIVQFRAAQLDAFQIEFALVCVGFTIAAARRGADHSRALPLAGAGAAAGAAMMVKLDGVLLAAGPATVLLISLAPRWKSARSWAATMFEGGAFALALIGVVASVYCVQTLWCHKPLDFGAPAAAIDARFMSTTYQHYLDGRRPWSPEVVGAAMRDSITFMFNDQAGIGLSDPNGSSPWLQPFGLKPINYRWDSQNGITRYVQLFANPINWTLSVAGLVAALLLVAAHRLSQTAEQSDEVFRQLAPIISTALAFYLGHGVLGSHRVMYLYHYFLPELLGILCLPFLARDLTQRAPRWLGLFEIMSWGVIVSSAAVFLWYAPLLYHRPMTRHSCELRNVPVQVVICRPPS